MQREEERRREDERCRRANPLLSGIYHPAAAPVYALLDRACISRAVERQMRRRWRKEGDDEGYKREYAR